MQDKDSFFYYAVSSKRHGVTTFLPTRLNVPPALVLFANDFIYAVRHGFYTSQQLIFGNILILHRNGAHFEFYIRHRRVSLHCCFFYGLPLLRHTKRLRVVYHFNFGLWFSLQYFPNPSNYRVMRIGIGCCDVENNLIIFLRTGKKWKEENKSSKQ